MLSRLPATTGAVRSTWRGVSDILSLGKEGSPLPGARLFNVFVLSVLGAAGVVAATGFCEAGVGIEKKCLFIADGSERRRLLPAEETEIVIPVRVRKI